MMRAPLLVALTLLAGCKGGCTEESPPNPQGPVSSSAPSPSAEIPAPSVTVSKSVIAPPADTFPLSDDEIAKIVNPTGATEYTGPTGTVEGVIKVTGDPSPLRTFMPLPTGCAGAAEVHAPVYRAGPKGELADALVAVLKVGGYVRPSKDDKTVVIKNCSVDPTVIDLSLGQRLMISNADSMPYTPQLATKMLVRRVVIKDMSPVPLFLTQPGAFGLTWLAGAMPGAAVPAATVFVLPNALHTVTGADGKFRITGIPAGKATITASHLDMPEVQKEIEIKPGAEVKVELTMTYKAPAAAPSASAPRPIPSIR